MKKNVIYEEHVLLTQRSIPSDQDEDTYAIGLFADPEAGGFAEKKKKH